MRQKILFFYYQSLPNSMIILLRHKITIPRPKLIPIFVGFLFYIYLLKIANRFTPSHACFLIKIFYAIWSQYQIKSILWNPITMSKYYLLRTKPYIARYSKFDKIKSKIMCAEERSKDFFVTLIEYKERLR